jgi:hypothetical protein
MRLRSDKQPLPCPRKIPWEMWLQRVAGMAEPAGVGDSSRQRARRCMPRRMPATARRLQLRARKTKNGVESIAKQLLGSFRQGKRPEIRVHQLFLMNIPFFWPVRNYKAFYVRRLGLYSRQSYFFMAQVTCFISLPGPGCRTSSTACRRSRGK